MRPAFYGLAALLLAILAVLLWDPGPAPTDSGAAGGPSPAAGADRSAPAAAAAASDPADRRREDSPAPPWATVQGQVVKPGWAEFPPGMLLVLQPQPGTEGETYRVAVDPSHPFFRLDRVPFGGWRLELRAAGFQSDPQLLTLTPDDPWRSLLVPLKPDRVIRGRVLGADGLPAAGARVTAQRVVEPGRAVLPLVARADERGEFELLGARPGTYRVHAGPARSPLSDPVQIAFAPEAREAWVELQLPPTGALLLRVESTGGEPVAGVRVNATRLGRGRGHVATEVSDPEGLCRFRHLPVGEYVVASVSGRHRSGTVRVTVLAGAEAEARLEVVPL